MYETSLDRGPSVSSLAPATVFSISYQGDSFFGVQQQPTVRTVLGELEKVISAIHNTKIVMLCAGRTDRGVHATHQVVAFTSHAERSDSAYLEGANGMLAPDLRIETVASLPNDFHPRYAAVSRTYTYVMYKGRYMPSAWMGRAYGLDRPVDVQAMRQAAQYLVGHHDFSAFRATGCQSVSPFRDIYHIDIEEKPSWVIVRITANAFLYRMVRKIIRAFLNVGHAQWKAEDMGEVLRAKDPSVLPPAPATGLYLTDVTYPEAFAKANKLHACWLDTLFSKGSV